MMAVSCLLCASMVPVSAQTQPAPKPFTKDDVVKLLTGNVPVKRLEALVRQRGIDFQLTPELESQLRTAGADDGLIATLKQSGPKAVSVPPPSATLVVNSSVGGARVYVDDVAIGDTSSQGRLRIPNLTPGQHQVRVSLDGYEKFEDSVELPASETLDLRVPLKANSPPAPTQVTSDHTGATASAIIELRVNRFGFGGGHTGWLRITDNVQYQSDDGKQNVEFGVSDIKEVKKLGGSIWRIRLNTGETHLFKSVDVKSRDTIGDAIHAALARTGTR